MDDFKGILISIKPYWCALIASGEKTVEVRKTKPKIDTPFKCFIYCTKEKTYGDFILCKSKETSNLFGFNTAIGVNKGFAKEKDLQLKGKIIGEFISNGIYPIRYMVDGLADMIDCELSCLRPKDFIEYGKGKMLYGWRITNFQIYDKPKELSEFGLKRPPQSWCYVEEAYNG